MPDPFRFHEPIYVLRIRVVGHQVYYSTPRARRAPHVDFRVVAGRATREIIRDTFESPGSSVHGCAVSRLDVRREDRGRDREFRSDVTSVQYILVRSARSM